MIKQITPQSVHSSIRNRARPTETVEPRPPSGGRTGGVGDRTNVESALCRDLGPQFCFSIMSEYHILQCWGKHTLVTSPHFFISMLWKIPTTKSIFPNPGAWTAVLSTWDFCNSLLLKWYAEAEVWLGRFGYFPRHLPTDCRVSLGLFVQRATTEMMNVGE